MNILDENVPESQRARLQRWRVVIRQIGVGKSKVSKIFDRRLLTSKVPDTFDFLLCFFWFSFF